MAQSSLARTDARIIRTRRIVLDAALLELAERGYGAFTIEGVASRAGVARSTIYRIWLDRTALIADAIEELNQQPPPQLTDDERPRARVETLVRHLCAAIGNSPVGACLPALIDGAERDRSLRQLHHEYNDRRRAALVVAIAHAVDAGEARSEIDPELAAIAIAGAIMYRRLMTARPMRDDEVEHLLATVFGPVNPTESVTS